jgi:CshA-type fibril repeat protein
VNDTTTTSVDVPAVLLVTANDTDSDGTVNANSVDLNPGTAGQQATITVPGEGTFTDNGSGTVTFTPDPGFVGTSSATYTIEDNDNTSSVAATMTVTVIAGPAANNDSTTTSLNNPVAIDVLANDVAGAETMLAPATVDLDPGTAGQQSTFAVAGEGTFTDDGSGTVTFTPDPGFVGTSTASYTVEDDLNTTSNAATITVTVDPIPPVATDDSTSTTFETAVSIPVLINDYDPTGDTLVISSVTQPLGGTVSFTPQGLMTYTPQPGFFGLDTFTYTLENSTGETAIATVSVTVGAAGATSHSPVAVADAGTTVQDTPVTVSVLPNDYDLDASPLTPILVDAATTQGGTASLNDNGTPGDPSDDTIDYTPAPGFIGTDTFSYTIENGNGSTDTAIVAIEVTELGANPRATAAGDAASTPHNVPIAISVLTNDTYPTPDPLTITVLTNGAHGTVQVDDKGTPGDPTDDVVIYTPDAGFIGYDTFTYTIVDVNGGRTAAAVTVAITNAAPIAQDDSVTTLTDTPVTVRVTDNDSDADGLVDASTVNLNPALPARQTTYAAAGQGTFTVDDNGNVTFTPEAGFTGVVTVFYTVNDDSGTTSQPATLSVTVQLDLIAPPLGLKRSTPVSLSELEIQIVWINNGNATPNRIQGIDPIPVNTTFVPGSLSCDAHGNSTVDRCEFDSSMNQVVYEGTLASDMGVTTEETAAHAVVMTFRLDVPIDFYGDVVNQAQANWDANGNGTLTDDLAGSQTPIVTDNPATTASNDATVSVIAVPPGVCLFQVRSTDGDSSSGDDHEFQEGAVQGGFESTSTRQVTSQELAITTPQPNQAIAGTAVAVAAMHIPSPGLSFSLPVPIVIANDNARDIPDLVEDQGVKIEVLSTSPDHVAITSDGVLVDFAEPLPQEETLDIVTVDAVDAPAPLPGTVVAGLWQLTLTDAQEAMINPVTLRFPYNDIDQDGLVEGMQPAIEENTLTLWRYDITTGWQPLPNAAVIPTANAVVVTTQQLGLFGIFQAANERAVIGNANNDVNLTVSLPTGLDPTPDPLWQDIGLSILTPLFITAWDTTQLANGAYELRAVCANGLSTLTTFQATAASTGGGGSSSCFIATAAYGSALAPQVRRLRDFRDAYLLPYAPGRWLVEQYYTFSPPLADMIRDRSWLRAGIRMGLTPVVWIATAIMQTTSWPFVMLIGSLLTGMGWYAWRRLHNA